MESIKVSKYQSVRVYIKKIPLLGSIIKIQRPAEPIPFDEIDRIAQNHHALFVKLEPTATTPSSIFHLPSFHSDSWPLLPTRTILIDLTADEETIFRRMTRDARHSIRRAEKEGVVVRCHSEPKARNLADIDAFYQLLKERGKEKGFGIPSEKEFLAKIEAFGPKAQLVLANLDGELLAGGLILLHDQVASCQHMATTALGRKLFAPYLLMWEILKLAKSQGCQTADLEGIYDPRYKMTRKWKKFTVFKKKFGGKIVEYPGPFIKSYNPLVKLLFKLNRLALRHRT